MRKKKQLTKQLCEQKKAAKLMAKDLETVSQKLFSLQKAKAAEAKRALMKPNCTIVPYRDHRTMAVIVPDRDRRAMPVRDHRARPVIMPGRDHRALPVIR